MAKHVFLSFVIEDLSLVNLFRGQAKNSNNELVFDDYSVREPFNSQNAEYIRSQIVPKLRASSVTICLIGSHTSESAWVDWEITKSIEFGNKVIGVLLDSSANVQIPKALTTNKSPVLRWDLEQIAGHIGR